jgi:thiol-disulfide isomerase/thioredoxin
MNLHDVIKLLKILKLTIFIFTINISCKSDSTTYTLCIEGSLENLPDGKLQIATLDKSIICSTTTNLGKFQIHLPQKVYREPLIVTLEHLDRNNVKRIFGFKTKLKLNGKPHFLSNFMLEDGIKMNGKLEEFISYSDKLKIVYSDKEIIAGRQNTVYFSEFFLNGTSYTKMKKSITTYPYSYYLLYELEKNRATFDKYQILTLFNSFDKKIQQSETGQKLKSYIDNHDNYLLSFDTEFITPDGNLKPAIVKNDKTTILILWASWCGPCRKEIPILKQLHSKYKYNKHIRMVSISLDEDMESWRKALYKEKMNWEQFIIKPELRDYQKDIFKFDGSIPTTLFIDKSGKIYFLLDKNGHFNLEKK